MPHPSQIATHFRAVFFGGNWTVSNVKDNLQGITWQEATKKVNDLNTIAVLTFHIGYFVEALIDVLEGKPLTSNDKFSFAHPPITSQEDWDKLVQKLLSNAEYATSLLEKLPDQKLLDDFTDKKYGTYYRNIHGIIEHTHYHLGQIALVKKLVQLSISSN